MTLRGLFFLSGLILFSSLNLSARADEAADEEAASETEATPTQSIYVEMPPAFVTNVGASGSRLSYVKAELTLRVSSPEAETAVRDHEPRLRHEMVMLLSSESRDMLSTTQGQDTLRAKALEAFNGVLADERTNAEIRDVLFTSFVVQK
ncbi:flagellar basal body-associated FliL family protein [Marinobacter sp. 1Y8]